MYCARIYYRFPLFYEVQVEYLFPVFKLNVDFVTSAGFGALCNAFAMVKVDANVESHHTMLMGSSNFKG